MTMGLAKVVPEVLLPEITSKNNGMRHAATKSPFTRLFAFLMPIPAMKNRMTSRQISLEARSMDDVPKRLTVSFTKDELQVM